MFKKRTQKGLKKTTAPTVAIEDDTAAALDDAKFAQEARKRCRGIGTAALGAAQAKNAPPPADDAPPDALGGLGRDFGASASSVDAVHERALEDYLEGKEDPVEPVEVVVNRDDALYAVPFMAGTQDVSKDAERAASNLTRLRAATGTAEVEVADAASSHADTAARRRRAANALPVSSAVLAEDRERMLDAAPVAQDVDVALVGTRGPHLWLRTDPQAERRKAQKRGRQGRCKG